MRQEFERILGEELRYLAIETRDRLGLTQKEMGEELQMGEGSYSELERGETLCASALTAIFAVKNAGSSQCVSELCSRTFRKGTATCMINVTYGVIEEIYSLGISSRTSYGIAAYADSAEDGTVTIGASVRDVTADKQALSKLVALCNRLELSTIHLNDVVEDFLVS